MAAKIAFIYIYESAPIARSVQRMLTQAFPEFEVKPFALSQLLKRRPDILGINTLFALREKGFSILKDRSAFRKAFIGTPFLFKQASELIRRKIQADQGAYAFSFQLQSLFDFSIPGLPHYVYTDHTHLENLKYEDFNPERLHSLDWLGLEKQIYQRAAHLFTRSTNISASLVEDYGIDPGKVSCVYVGVNVPADADGDDLRRSVNKKVLFVGVDWVRKGGPELVEAFKKVLAQHPDASLTIIGCKPELNLPNTRVVGYLPPEEVKEHYQQASLFCLPTRLEPFGVVFVEAMSYGLPILATDIGAIPDFVQPDHNGFLVAPGDVDALGSKLTTMLGDPELLQRFGAFSRRLAKERYNWESVGTRIRARIMEDLQS